ncbi:MAG: hypothetical protein JXB15_04400 [Anaerolineales bacterium]|nr:hypothetical protein [Anaerolineales bacterium]
MDEKRGIAFYMNNKIIRSKKPEEAELEMKRAELAALESELARYELDLATLQAELRAFNLRYMKVVGIKFVRLDELDALISEVLVQLNPTVRDFAEKLEQARKRAQESARTVGASQLEPEEHTRFVPTEDLKTLYRDLAKMLHPDLSTDEEERVRRTKWMADVNDAYQRCDEARLQEIRTEWETSPETVEGDDIGAELVRAIRKIAQVQRRIAAIQSETTSLQESSIFHLKIEVEKGEKTGRDVLAAMASQADQQIIEKEARLKELIKELHTE